MYKSSSVFTFPCAAMHCTALRFVSLPRLKASLHFNDFSPLPMFVNSLNSNYIYLTYSNGKTGWEFLIRRIFNEDDFLKNVRLKVHSSMSSKRSSNAHSSRHFIDILCSAMSSHQTGVFNSHSIFKTQSNIIRSFFGEKKNTRQTFFLFCATKLFYLYLISSHFIFTFTKILSIIIIYSVYK